MNPADDVARSSRRTTLVAVAVVLVATISACTGGGGTSATPTSKVTTEAAYLTALAPIATSVRAAMAPIDDALVAYESFTPDSIAARDSLAHTAGAAAIAMQRRELSALRPPPSLMPEQQRLVRATATMATAVTGLVSMGSQNTIAIVGEKLDTLGEQTLVGAEDDWTAALRAAFSAGHRPTPILFAGGTESTPPSRSSWILGADVACVSANDQLNQILISDQSQRATPRHPTAAERRTESADQRTDIRQLSSLLTVLGKQLTAVPTPTGVAALPQQVSSGLGVLRLDGRLLPELLVASKQHNQVLIARTYDQLTQSLPDGVKLGQSLNAYGSVECEVFISGVYPLLEKAFVARSGQPPGTTITT
jgi:hypothetical protein